MTTALKTPPSTPWSKVVSNPGYITFQLPGHEYTMTVYRRGSLVEWVSANRNRIQSFHIDETGDFDAGELVCAVRGNMPRKEQA